MKIISFIEDEEVIRRILKHLWLWKMKVAPLPKVKTPLIRSNWIIQIPSFYFLPLPSIWTPGAFLYELIAPPNFLLKIVNRKSSDHIGSYPARFVRESLNMVFLIGRI